MRIFTFVLGAMFAMGVYLGFRLAAMLRRAGLRRWIAFLLAAAGVALMLWRRELWGLFIYLVIAFAAGDIISLLVRQKWWEKIWCGGATCIAIALGLCAYGYFHARDIRTTHYEIAIAKKAGGLQGLRAVVISDMHIGTTIRAPELAAMAERINALAPDIVLLAGDIYDESTPPGLVPLSLDMWRGVRAPRGIYFVGGNHEYGRYFGSKVIEVFPKLRAAGVRVLEDEATLVGGAFYIVGRKDLRVEGRANIGDLTRGLDKTRPIILLDHQPVGLEESAAAGVDLTLAGHTHAGQIWPVNLAIQLPAENEVLYGHARRGEMQAVVSSGAGAWGFPMRVGTNSEIVVIDIGFGK